MVEKHAGQEDDLGDSEARRVNASLSVFRVVDQLPQNLYTEKEKQEYFASCVAEHEAVFSLCSHW